MTRRFLHCLVAEVAFYSGLTHAWLSFRRRVLRQRPVCVIGLHRILTQEARRQSNSQEGMVMTTETFHALLRYLRKCFDVVTLKDLCAGDGARGRGSRPACVLTFDDGWKDNFTTAWPILQRHQIPATIFLITGLVNGGRGSWIESLRAACREPERARQIQSKLDACMQCDSPADLDEQIEFLKHMPAAERQRLLGQLLPTPGHGYAAVDAMVSWDEIREMARAGIEFGTHTVTHPLLTFEPDAVVDQELRASKEILESVLGCRVTALAYPNGDWDDRVRKRVRHAGYDCAVTTRPGWYRPGDDLFTIKRVLLQEGNVTGWRGRFSPAMLHFTLLIWH